MDWLSLSTPTWWIRNIPVKLFTLFRRKQLGVWGCGLLFVKRRHMFYVGDAGINAFWMRL